MKSKQRELSILEEILQDGMTIMTGGYASCGIPDRLIEGVLECGVRELTIISNDAAYPGRGVSRLLEERRVRKMITTHIGRNPLAGKLYGEGKLELELVPQGTLAERIRIAGAGLGGFLTEVGLGTEVEQGKEKVQLRGKTYLLEEPLHADLALIRGAKADTFGNLVYEGTSINFNPLMATAAETVIADVGEVLAMGAFAPEQVMTSGVFVDYVVEGYPMTKKWLR